MLWNYDELCHWSTSLSTPDAGDSHSGAHNSFVNVNDLLEFARLQVTKNSTPDTASHSGAHYSFVNANDLLKFVRSTVMVSGRCWTLSIQNHIMFLPTRQQYIITILLETTNMMQLPMCAYCCCTTFRPACWHSIEWMLLAHVVELICQCKWDPASLVTGTS